MAKSGYRVESDHPINGPLWPRKGAQQHSFRSRELAVAMAAKSETRGGHEIRVVHEASGEVIFRKPSSRRDKER